MKLFLYLLPLLLSEHAYPQKASLHVRLIDSSFASPSDWIFEVEVRNNSFDRYWIQDTSIIQKGYLHHYGPYYSILQRNYNGKYLEYPYVTNAGDIIGIDSSQWYCQGCIFLKKGESIKINTPLLHHATLENGAYHLWVMLDCPMGSCNNCEQLGEIYSEYFFSLGHISHRDSTFIDSITTVLRSFPEVKAMKHSMPPRLKKIRKLAIWVDHFPSPDKNFYVFGVGPYPEYIQNSFFDFHVWVDPVVIKYCDPIMGIEMTLDEWRKTRRRQVSLSGQFCYQRQ